MTNVDFDANQYLTDAFETLIALSGDPAAQVDRATRQVLAAHMEVLRRLALRHREDLIGMAEERKATGKMVATRWKLR